MNEWSISMRVFGWIVRKLGGPGPALIWCQIAIVFFAVIILACQASIIFGGSK